MSDVLIKGMEMPKDGFITITVTSDGRVVGNSKKESGKFEYLDNEDIAKAIPVPPHGDLVDRSGMREIAISLLDKAVTDQEANAIREMWSHLRQMPVFIPADPEEEEIK